MRATVRVDQELCIGSAECGRIAPDAFALDEALGVSVALPGATATPVERLIEAGRNCPTNAITVTGADGSLLVRSAR